MLLVVGSWWVVASRLSGSQGKNVALHDLVITDARQYLGGQLVRKVGQNQIQQVVATSRAAHALYETVLLDANLKQAPALWCRSRRKPKPLLVVYVEIANQNGADDLVRVLA